MVAIKRKQPLSQLLKIKNDYEAFCIDEVGLYLYVKWKAGEKTYNENWKDQSMSLTSRMDKTMGKNNKGFKGKKWQ